MNKDFTCFKVSSLALLAIAAGIVAGQTKPITQTIRRVTPSPPSAPAPPAPAPTQSAPPDPPLLASMPHPLTKTWPDTPTIVLQTVPFSSSFYQPYPGEGPNQCWIPVEAFSIEKDLTSAKKEYVLKFTTKAGPWSTPIMTACGSIWPLDYEFHALSNGNAMVVAARGTMKNFRWFWSTTESCFLEEVTLQSYKYYMGPG